MELLYIAAPYRADTIVQIQHNIHQATLMAQFYWLKGYAVICPHMNSANFDGLVPDKAFLESGLKLLTVCNHVAFHPDWTTSKGCMKEYKLALAFYKIKLHFTNMDRVNRTIKNHFFTKKHIDDIIKEG